MQADAVVVAEGGAGIARGGQRRLPARVVARLGCFEVVRIACPRGSAGEPDEGEIDGASLQICVGEVRHDECVLRDCLAHRTVQQVETVPGGGHVHRVDERARGEQGRLPVADPISIREPLLSRRGPEVLRAVSAEQPGRKLSFLARVGLPERPVAFESKDEQRSGGKRVDEAVQQGRRAQREPQRFGLRAVGDPAQRLGHRDATITGPAAREQRVERVVQTGDRGTQARSHQRAQPEHACSGRLEAQPAHPSRRRRGPAAQPRFGDDPQRAFAADEELHEVGPSRRCVLRAQQVAHAVHGLEREDDVLDFPVPRRELPGAARRKPSADR